MKKFIILSTRLTPHGQKDFVVKTYFAYSMHRAVLKFEEEFQYLHIVQVTEIPNE